MNRIEKLHQLGQSIWYDNIQRRLLENGELVGMIARGDIRGVTSNPSIFNNAIAKTNDYDAALKPMAWAGWTAEKIFEQLAVEDIRAAADLFRPLYDETQGQDGFVSLEVSPFLAHDSAGTLSEAKRLWGWVNRPNLMIKIPATKAGMSAVRSAIAAGINVNVTLIFSLERYAEVLDAFASGLEDRLALGLPVNGIASVASFFVSRVDTKIDPQLATHRETTQAKKLLGKAAIANAKLAYALFEQTVASARFKQLSAHGAQLQRPLWASTSTKNPAFRDVIYVEELIGPHTVNTMPPQTLDAFRQHGEARLSLTSGIQQAQADIKALEALGISMKVVTQELEDEGIKAFADAYTALLKAVEQRRIAAQAELGPLQKPVAARVAKLDQDQTSQRMADIDPTLWTQDAAGQAEIRKRMGWLNAPQVSRELIPELQSLVAEVQQAGFTHALLLGMGGSSLAPEVLALTFGIRESNGNLGLDLAILDSTDPAQVRAAANRSTVEHTLYIVASKSGGTSEVNAFMDYFWHRTELKVGKHVGGHFIAITDPGTALDKLATERGFRRVIYADPTVGGRNSALAAFGVVSAMLMGLDVDRLLGRAAWMADQCSPHVPSGRNPGLVLGAVLGEAAIRGRDKLTILTDPELSAFGAWMEQLIAESTGKQGVGIVPVDGEPMLRGRFGFDRLFVYLRQSGAEAKTAARLRKQGQPVLEISVPTEYDLAAEFYRWEVATAIACVVLEVNPFDQPDVQDNKLRTNQKIDAFREKHYLKEAKAAWQSGLFAVFGQPFPGLEGASTVAEVLQAFLKQVKPGDYVALNAYLPRNLRTLSQLQNVRKAVLKQTGAAVTLGFGPRFLHSTGQLHKGGADNGVFVQITAETTADIDIPGQGMTFGTLLRAQALGDLEALQARGRRVLRIHLFKGAKLSELVK